MRAAFRITIDVTEDGRVLVTGPLLNKVLALGALELAKQVVVTHEPKDGPRIVPPLDVPR